MRSHHDGLRNVSSPICLYQVAVIELIKVMGVNVKSLFFCNIALVINISALTRCAERFQSRICFYCVSKVDDGLCRHWLYGCVPYLLAPIDPVWVGCCLMECSGKDLYTASTPFVSLGSRGY